MAAESSRNRSGRPGGATRCGDRECTGFRTGCGACGGRGRGCGSSGRRARPVRCRLGRGGRRAR
jgi:hypothetical protein